MIDLICKYVKELDDKEIKVLSMLIDKEISRRAHLRIIRLHYQNGAYKP